MAENYGTDLENRSSARLRAEASCNGNITTICNKDRSMYEHWRHLPADRDCTYHTWSVLYTTTRTRDILDYGTGAVSGPLGGKLPVFRVQGKPPAYFLDIYDPDNVDPEAVSARNDYIANRKQIGYELAHESAQGDHYLVIPQASWVLPNFQGMEAKDAAEGAGGNETAASTENVDAGLPRKIPEDLQVVRANIRIATDPQTWADVHILYISFW